MANLIILDTGLDHVYPDGVPINELIIDVSIIFKRTARVTSLTALADPYFNKLPGIQRTLAELHGEGDRITTDFLENGAMDILPVFSPFQRWMVTVDSPEKFSFMNDKEVRSVFLPFDLAGYIGGNSGQITYRWLNTDTRQGLTSNYTADMYQEICMDPNAFANIRKYLENALVDFLLKELYRAIGYDKKYIDYNRSYEQNRQYVAYWLKNDRSTKTQYRHAGV